MWFFSNPVRRKSLVFWGCIFHFSNHQQSYLALACVSVLTVCSPSVVLTALLWMWFGEIVVRRGRPGKTVWSVQGLGNLEARSTATFSSGNCRSLSSSPAAAWRGLAARTLHTASNLQSSLAFHDTAEHAQDTRGTLSHLLALGWWDVWGTRWRLKTSSRTGMTSGNEVRWPGNVPTMRFLLPSTFPRRNPRNQRLIHEEMVNNRQ